MRKFYLLLICCSLFAEEVVHLTPPQIFEGSLSEHMIGFRPVRTGGANLSLEQREGKTLIHCYGHGGTGWTALFSSVRKAVELYEATSPSKEIPIHIIGSGCMGLATAIELSERGFHVTGLSTKDLYGGASWKAAGFFLKCHPENCSEEELKEFNEASTFNFSVYTSIKEGNHPFLSKDLVRLLPVYESKQTRLGLEQMVNLGLIPEGKEVTLDFGNGVRHTDFLEHFIYAFNVAGMMKGFIEEVHRLEIPIVEREINSFADVEESVVFNCSGLGSRELNRDSDLSPVAGLLIALNEQASPKPLDYMICTEVTYEGKREILHFWPRELIITSSCLEGLATRGVLGGTFLENLDKLTPLEQEALYKREFEKILDWNSIFFFGHSYRPFIET